MRVYASLSFPDLSFQEAWPSNAEEMALYLRVCTHTARTIKASFRVYFSSQSFAGIPVSEMSLASLNTTIVYNA